MEINREILLKLKEWKDSKTRKPLIIHGARQIGKTWAMLKFGAMEYENVAYFNFDLSEELCKEFEKTKDPNRLIGILGLYTDAPIKPHTTLIIFDGIQQSNKALNSLKYFCEVASDYHVVAAGSLLGVSLSKGDSFPVGKVEFLNMYPISFKEFLHYDNPKIWNYLNSISSIENLPEIVFNVALESFRRYEISGGMPAATVAMLEGKGIEEVETILNGILTSYALDFSKHAPTQDIPRISAIWKSIPSQLARENRKFVYKLVKDGARAREYENGLLWLDQAGIIQKIYCMTKPGLPLSAYDDLAAFKIYLSDMGLLRKLASLPASVFYENNPLYVEFKGALAENAVLQSLVVNFDVKPRYWVSSGIAEIDFVLQYKDKIIPIEVKAGESISGKSLSVYKQKYNPPIAIRYSMINLSFKDGIINIPIFLADWTTQILEKI